MHITSSIFLAAFTLYLKLKMQPNRTDIEKGKSYALTSRAFCLNFELKLITKLLKGIRFIYKNRNYML